MTNRIGAFPLAVSAALLLTPGTAGGQTPAPDKPASIEGIVTNSLTGEPLPRVHVLLSGVTMDTPRQYGAMTTAEGKFSIAGIIPGSYFPSAQRVGFVAPPVRPQTDRLVLAADDKKSDVKLALIPTGAIAGHITDADGAPVDGASVTAEGPETTQSATTDDKGEFRIGGLAPGKYRVKAAIANRLPLAPETRTDGTEEVNYATTYFPGSVDAKTAARVEVRAAVDASGVDIRMARYPFVRVSGRVIGMPPGANGSVSAQQGTSFRGSGMVRKDGSFEIWRLDPGKYTLTANWNNRDRLSPQPSKVMVEVAGANIENVEIRIVPLANLSGRLEFDDDGARQIPQPPQRTATQRQGAQQPPGQQPAPRRTVYLREIGSFNMGTAPAAVGPDDTFTLKDVPPSRYRVEVNPGSAYVKSVRLGTVATDGPVLDLSQGANAGEVSLLLSSATGSVSGVVKDDSDSVAGARIVIVPADGGTMNRRYASAQSDGSYSFSDLAPGAYRIVAVAKADTDLVMQQNGLEMYDGLMDEIEIHPGDKVTKDLKRRVPN